MALLLECQFAVDVTDLPELQQFRDWAERALRRGGETGEVRTMGLRVVAPAESRRLNQQFRGVDRPTNVLAFPAGSDGWPPGEPVPLGELVICAAIVADEASEQSKTPLAHWCHMVIHGTLHLAGFDHAGSADAAEMEAVECELLAEFGFTDPYSHADSRR